MNVYQVGEFDVVTSSSREEWWDIIRSHKPEITWEEFEDDWSGFLHSLIRRSMN